MLVSQFSMLQIYRLFRNVKDQQNTYSNFINDKKNNMLIFSWKN